MITQYILYNNIYITIHVATIFKVRLDFTLVSEILKCWEDGHISHLPNSLFGFESYYHSSLF